MPVAPLRNNRLLSSLPAVDLKRLKPDLEWVELEFKQVLFDVDLPIEHVYFPDHAIVSVLAVMPDGSGIEVATIGSEGMVGLPVFLGSDSMSAQAFVQVPGQGWRMRSDRLRAHSQELPALRHLLERYTQALFTLISQGAACNRLHSIEERCARWLLMTRDRVESDTFPLTQQFLSQMLGVRRASVSEVAAVLQDEGLIRYSRGSITLLDPEGLRSATCECYGIIRDEFDRLLESGTKPGGPPPGRLLKPVSKQGRSTLGDGTPRPRRKVPRKKPRG